jgi:hypothetical protein
MHLTGKTAGSFICRDDFDGQPVRIDGAFPSSLPGIRLRSFARADATSSCIVGSDNSPAVVYHIAACRRVALQNLHDSRSFRAP